MAEQKNVGTIVEIKGVVIDAVFLDGLPEILTALEIQVPREDGSTTLVAEVQQHLGDDRVRAVAMDATDGLSRGTDVLDTGQPITGAGRPGDARPALERDRRSDRREGGGAGGRGALADPSRPTRVP